MSNLLPTVAATPRGAPVVPINSVQDIQALGQILAQSKMFGADTNPAQGVVIAGMCMQEGMSWAKWSQTYNLIHGQVSKRTDAMLADYQRMGGKYKVVRRDPEGASVKFDFNGTVYTSSCLWDDIKDEPYTVSPKTGQLKDKYAKPRSRMQMLWARAVSDGLRVVCPMCCAGVYTPEETSDFTETDGDRPAPARFQPSGTGRTMPAPDSEVAAVSDSPSAAPASNAEPTPFEDAAPADAAPDYSVCPIPGKLFGKPWTEISDSALTMALNFTPDQAPALTDGHRDAIRAEIARRMETTQQNNEAPNA